MSAPTISFTRDLQFLLEYAGLRAIIGLVRLLPLETATALSAKAWRAWSIASSGRWWASARARSNRVRATSKGRSNRDHPASATSS